MKIGKEESLLLQSFHFGLFLTTGISSWLLVNSLFVEMGYFISVLPEEAAIATQISLLIQISNFVPLFYVIFVNYVPNNYIISLLLIFAIFVSMLIAGFWEQTITFFNTSTSLPLLALAFCSGLVGTTSVVLYYPFASRFSPVFTSAISLGMGLTGAVSSILASIQYVFNFSVSLFFIFNAIILVFCLLSFIVIIIVSKKILVVHQPINFYIADEEKQLNKEIETQTTLEPLTVVSMVKNDLKSQSEFYAILLISNQFLICLIFYFLIVSIPFAVQNFSTELTTYIYTGSIFIGSVGRFFCIFSKLRFSSPFFIIPVTLVQVILGIYLAIQCFTGYALQNEAYAWVIANIYIFVAFLNGYEDTLLYQVAAITQEPERIEKITRYIGLSNQAGAFLGSILSFIFVEFNLLH